jgi:hypothetical protein
MFYFPVEDAPVDLELARSQDHNAPSQTSVLTSTNISCTSPILKIDWPLEAFSYDHCSRSSKAQIQLFLQLHRIVKTLGAI